METRNLEKSPKCCVEDDLDTGGYGDDEQEPLITDTIKSKAPWKSCLLEPFLFAFFFGYAMSVNVESKLFFDRACTINLDRSLNECKGNDTELFNRVQIIANNYLLFNTLIRFIPSTVVGFFIGPWSDKYGKKPPIFLSVVGLTVSSALMFWYTTDEKYPLYYTLLISIPGGISGGTTSCMACLYAMASECTSLEARTTKYAFLELSIAIAIPLAMLTAGYLYDTFGYEPVYLLNMIVYCVPLVLLFFVEDEGRRLKAPWKTKVIAFFSCESIKENVRTVLKNRERHGRKKILLLFVSTVIIVLNLYGISNILYFFCQKMYKWSVLYYTKVSTAGNISSTVIVLGLVPVLIKVFKVSDAWIGLLGLVSLMAQEVVRAYAYRPWMYYTSVALGLPSLTAPFAVRSIISKTVENHELGKVFALLSEMEALVPIVGALVATQVYNASISFFPGLLLLIVGVPLLFPIGVFVWLMRLQVASETTSANVQHPTPEVK